MEKKDKAVFILEENQYISDDEEQTISIEEALRLRKEELETINLDFKYLWMTYRTVLTSSKIETEQFRLALLRTNISSLVARLLSFLYRGDASEQMAKLGLSLSESLKELKAERELLREIKVSIKKLQKYQMVDCNGEISKLLSLLDEKNVLMDGILREDTRALEVRMKGINYSSNTGLRTKLSTVNSDINGKALALGLNQKQI